MSRELWFFSGVFAGIAVTVGAVALGMAYLLNGFSWG